MEAFRLLFDGMKAAKAREDTQYAAERIEEAAKALSQSHIVVDHRFEVGPNLAQTAQITAVAVTGWLLATHGIDAVKEIRKERAETSKRNQDAAEFRQDQTVLGDLRTPGYSSKLGALGRVKFQSDADAALYRLAQQNRRMAELYKTHYEEQFLNKTN